MPEITGKKVCCFCNAELPADHWSSCAPWPVNNDKDARCCQECDDAIVTPARVYLLKKERKKTNA
jgi:hypothetical protein